VAPANSVITGYVVLIDDGLHGSFRVGYDSSRDPSKTNATILGLNSSITYRIKVNAQNKAGFGSNSSEVLCYTASHPA